ncbi:MAG TPA: HAMP domain-containing methyl-accepting chemotaxis protein [Dongiaceae bacterium]|nr:HAMP domain-containing methyl-accepting chemotaxis protein [Dongiaceae bacterium]
MNYWVNLPIGRRIAIGFASVIIALGLAIGLAVTGLLSGKDSFSSYAIVADNTADAIQLDRQLTGLRRNLGNYVNNADDASLARLVDLRKSVSQTIDNLQATVRNPERQSMLQQAEDIMAAVAPKVDHTIELRGTIQKLRDGTMTPNGGAITNALADTYSNAKQAGNLDLAAAAGDARSYLLAMRFDMSRLLDRGDIQILGQLPKDFDNAKSGLRETSRLATGELVAKIADATQRLDKYIDGARQSAQMHSELLPLFDEVDKNIAKVSEILGALVKSAKGNLAQTTTQNDSLISRSIALSGAISVVAGLMGMLIGFGVTRSITGPISNITSAMGTLAGGDTTLNIPALERKDEVGKMAQAVQVFKESMIANREMTEREAAEQEVRAARARKIARLTEDFDRETSIVVKTVASAATELQSTATSMTATAEETSRQATAVAAASEQASANVQTVASAAEELASSVSEISRQVSESTMIAGDAVSHAERSGHLVKKLSEAAERIGAVVNLINEIASQTNLLALNATIEAARAGEAGKGFAVVASEVKSLANQTAKATDDIATQISSIQAVTGDTVQAIEGISGIIRRVNEITTSIAAAVEEQGAATNEIARNVQQAAQGTQEVSSNIVNVTTAAQHTGAAATQLLGASGELSKQAEQMRANVEQFVSAVQAA